jgi:threonine/homoserine/homoserine lactone efflux protein
VALFFLAFVPQFIAPDAPDKALAFILLGCIFNLNGMIWCHLLVFSTAYARNKVKLPARIGRWLNRGIGTLFVGLGIKLASD